jgi:hypothetical protein
MNDPRDVPTLTDAEIQTRRVDGGKRAWEAPRLMALDVTGSESGTSHNHTEAFGDDGTSDTNSTYYAAPS